VRTLLTIAAREARSLLSSPVAYVAAALAVAIFGLFFTAELSDLTQARLDGWFESSAIVLLFLAPVLAMRSLAEEQRSGSLDVLRAGPIADLTIVVGKFLGLASVYVLILVATLPAPLLVERWAGTEEGPLLTGYLGLLLLGLASLGVGLLASACSSHQAVAAVIGFVALVVLWMLQGLSDVFAGTTSDVLAALGTTSYLAPLNRGLLRLDGVVYYVSVAFVTVLLAARVVEARRWR
jgi:ABC-2 type transport system permease protein